MDKLSSIELRRVPTEKLIEQISHLLTELKSREPSNGQKNDFHAKADALNARPPQNGDDEQAALANEVREAGLSNREREVLLLMGEGLSSRKVAEHLQLSIHTIETYREKLKTKLNLKNAAELWHFAVRWGMLIATKRRDGKSMPHAVDPLPEGRTATSDVLLSIDDADRLVRGLTNDRMFVDARSDGVTLCGVDRIERMHLLPYQLTERRIKETVAEIS